MKKLRFKTAAFAALLLASAAASYAGAGIYDSFAIVNGSFYDLGATTGLPDFQGANLGTFDISTAAQLKLGGQEKSFKNNFTDVTGHMIEYRLYSGSPTGAFTAISYGFQWNAFDSGAPGNLNNSGDQQWGTDAQGAHGSDSSVNILTGLANGTYTLEAYSQITTNGVNEAGSIANNNGGNNYKATFTVVPEPSSISMLIGSSFLGCLYLVRRRRLA